MGGLERRHALINTNLTTEEETCKQFLASLDFRKETLVKLAKVAKIAGPYGSKDELAKELADAVAKNQVPIDQFVIEFCKQAKQWLAFLPAKLGGMCPPQLAARDLFTRFGSKNWYGPFVEDKSTHWLVYCHIAPTYVEVGQEGDKRIFKPFAARWHVVAKITGDVVSLHWNNFSYTEDLDDATHDRERQFPYWRFIPNILKAASGLYQATSTATEELHSFILHTLYERYPQSAETSWQHLKVRAMANGVAVNAGGREEKDSPSGVQKLTRSLAAAAMQELGVPPDDATMKSLDRALLKTVLHEWGVKSYNFSVTTPDQRSFRAHCYFGADEGADTPDCFPHFLTTIERGGSLAALDFLAAEMRR